MNSDEIELEARRALGRKALQEKTPIGRLEGGLGGSPVAPIEQLRLAAATLLHELLPDGDGALLQVLEQDLRQEEAALGALARQVSTDKPEGLRVKLLELLRSMAERPLATEAALVEFTRRVDARWGELFGTRPHFQRPGQAAHPDDPYTHESVRRDLEALLSTCAAGNRR